MNSGKIHIVYLVGIGGIGMSALARWYNHAGISVSGYDLAPSPLTEELTAEGISITFDDSVESIPQVVKEGRDNTWIVFTPAVPTSHPQMEFFRQHGYSIRKRSEALGEITRGHFTIAVAGTHGKTTTTTLIAHILKTANKNFAAFLGGISANFGTNFLINGEFNDRTIVVAEADEFDRSFLRLSPDIAVITSTDADHLDIYGDKANVLKSYGEFVGKITKGGQLIVNEEAPESIWKDMGEKLTVQTYGLEKGKFFSTNVRINRSDFIFDYYSVQGLIEQLRLQTPGFHNVENATAAITVALNLGIDAMTIIRAVKEFKGAKRRFEYIFKSSEAVFIDDYAHHPAEIEALLKSVAAMYPDKKITVIFQPHLYSRTRDFANEFAHSLDLAHEILLLNIYPAREQPIEGVTSTMILNKLKRSHKAVVSKEELLRRIANERKEVLITIGAGDIDRMVPVIKQTLEKREGVGNEKH